MDDQTAILQNSYIGEGSADINADYGAGHKQCGRTTLRLRRSR